MIEELTELARLIRTKNSIDRKIAKIVGRPALIGHVGEYIAARLFEIELNRSATTKGSDGYFRTGPLAARRVNIKWYPKNEHLLDLSLSGGPDYYLVLAGPRSSLGSSRGTERPWAIESVYIFEGTNLLRRLSAQGVRIGTATSVRLEVWDAGEVYPGDKGILHFNDEQRRSLKLFAM